RQPLRWFLATLFLVIWASYRFSLGPLLPPGRLAQEDLSNAGAAERTVLAVLNAPIYPAAELPRGIIMLVQRVNAHRKNYFFGSVPPEGRWQYYTTTLLLKTPIPLLLLAAFGAIAGRMSDERTRRATVLPLALTLIILLALMPTDLNIGVRHVMPLYPLLILAA